MPYKQVPVSPMGGNGQTPEPAFVPDPELKPSGRRYPTWYKLKILQEADACTQDGQIGALLRREGIYHCTLTCFRRQRASGMLGNSAKEPSGKETPAEIAVVKKADAKETAATEASRQRSSKTAVLSKTAVSSKTAADPDKEASRTITPEQARWTLKLERENRDLRRRLYQAEVLLELQKKVAELFGDSQEGEEADTPESVGPGASEIRKTSRMNGKP
jgi:transposase